MIDIYITLFGTFQVRDHAQQVVEISPRRCQELLSFLLLHDRQALEREKLATLMWGDASPSQARRNLRQTLWQLQSVLNAQTTPIKDLLLVDREYISLNPAVRYWLDVEAFESCIVAHKATAAKDMTHAQVEQLKKALDLYQTGLLETWYMDWCILERERYQAMHLAALEKLLLYSYTHQHYNAGLAYGDQILRCDKAHERTHRRLMQIRYRAGDRSGAINQYRSCIQALNEELGVGPSQDTVRLYQRICDDQSGLSAADTTVTVETNGNGSTSTHTGFHRHADVAELEEIQRTLAQLQQKVAEMIQYCRQEVTR